MFFSRSQQIKNEIERCISQQIENERQRSMIAAVTLYAAMKSITPWLYGSELTVSTAIDLSVSFIGALYLGCTRQTENTSIEAHSFYLVQYLCEEEVPELHDKSHRAIAP